MADALPRMNDDGEVVGCKKLCVWATESNDGLKRVFKKLSEWSYQVWFKGEKKGIGHWSKKSTIEDEVQIYVVLVIILTGLSLFLSL